MISMEENRGLNQGYINQPSPNYPPPVDDKISDHSLSTASIVTAGTVRKRRPRFIVIVIVVFLVLILIGVGFFLRSKNGVKISVPKINITNKETAPSISTAALDVTPTPIALVVEGTANWNIYKKEGAPFSFKYPKDVELTELKSYYIKLSKSGPAQQEGTEFKDGVSISFRTFESGGLTLKQAADATYLSIKGDIDVTQSVVASIGGATGYTFHVKGGINADYYYLAINDKLYLEVVNATKDPGKAGFKEVAATILATLVLNP